MWHQKKLNTLLNPYIEILKSFIKPSSNNKKEPFTKDPFFSKPPLDKSWNKHTLNEKRPNKMPQIISCQADLMSFLKRLFSNWHDLVWKIVKKRLYKKVQRKNGKRSPPAGAEHHALPNRGYRGTPWIG